MPTDFHEIPGAELADINGEHVVGQSILKKAMKIIEYILA
jgi:hypothetical protein